MKRKIWFLWLMPVMIFLASHSAFAADQVLFYHTDPVGTPLAMTDATGNVVWKGDYKPFGEEHSVTATTTNDRRLVGKEKDEETGLEYFGARYMESRIGRFTAVDPVRAVDPKASKTNEKMSANPQRLNTYVYALNNPYRYFDPDGRDVAFFVDAQLAGGNGHTSLFYQDAQGGWYQYDQGAAGAAGSSEGNLGYLLGFDAPAGVSIKPVDGPPEGSVIIKTTRSQDEKIANQAITSQLEHNTGVVKYNIYSNNCTDAATDVVNKSGAGITVPNPWSTIKPNTWFKGLKENLQKQTN